MITKLTKEQEEIEKLKAKIEKYESALKFYADHNNYSLFGLKDDHSEIEINLKTGEGFKDALKTVGRRARQALCDDDTK